MSAQPTSGLFALVRYVSFRYVIAAPVRSLLTLFGVALGVAMVVGMTSVNGAILASFREMVDRAGGRADLEVLADESGVPQEIVDQLVDRSDLAHLSARLEKTTLLGREGGSLGDGERSLVLGIDFLGDLTLVPFEREGKGEKGSGNPSGEQLVKDPLSFINDPLAILLSETLAQKLGVGAGGSVRMRTAFGVETFHVEGVVKETSKAKAFGGRVAILSIDAAQRAFGAEGRVDRIDIEVAKGLDKSKVQAELQALVGGRAEVSPPSRRGKQTEQMLQSVSLALSMSAAIAMIVGMFLIYNTVTVSVAQRRRDLGILRAVGVTRRRLVSTILAESLVLSLVGGAIGVFLGGLLARVVVKQVTPTVSRFYTPILPPPPEVDKKLALLGIALGVLATLVAAWLPARRAAKMSPVETLRRDLIVTGVDELPVGKLGVLGLLVCGLSPLLELVLRRPGVPAALPGYTQIAVVMLGAALTMPLLVVSLHRVLAPLAQRALGLPARLGVDNVVRSLGRSSTTAAALMLATCASIAIGGYARSLQITVREWLDQSVPGDVFITAGSPLLDRHAMAFHPDSVKKLFEPPIPGVVAVDYIRSLRVAFRGRRVSVLANDTALYFSTIRAHSYRRVVEGDADVRTDDLTKEPAVWISENLARAFDLHPGGSIALPTPTGERWFKIRAVVVDYSDERGWMLMDRMWVKSYWYDDRIDNIKLFLAGGGAPGEPAPIAEAERVAEEVRRRLSSSGGDGAGDGLFVATSARVKAEVRDAIDQTFKITDSSQLIAFIVSLLGVIGTMLAAVIDRTREIGVLRAIGATRRQVAIAVMCEAAFIGLCSAVLAIAAGVPASYLFTRVVGVAATGWNVPFHFPWIEAIRTGLAIVFTATIAGLVPGRRAAGMKVTSALAYE
jgi:putative ABC transport system permease protein